MMMMRTLFILRLADRVPYFRRLYDSLLSVYDKLTIEFDWLIDRWDKTAKMRKNVFQ